jgi:NAD(P)H dehydrogenase (quinone)
MPLAITGSSGVLGGMVARQLAAAHVPQRLLARNPERAPRLPGAVVVQSSYSDRAGAEKALEGIDTLFMVSASESADRLDQHRTFVAAAAAAGVGSIVYTSFAGAAADATFTLARDHDATERYIRESGMRYTFLRDNLYIDFLSDLVGEDGVIRGPAGDGRAAVVARADVARVAAAVLQAPESHAGATSELTGPEALPMTEVAAILTDLSGRPVVFQNETIEEAYASRARWGAPDWQLDAWVSTYTAIAAGELAHVSDDVERITGAPPMGLAEFLRREQRYSGK